MELEEIRRRLRESKERLGEPLFLKTYIDASHECRDNFERILEKLEKTDPPAKAEKVGILEFREKLHSYHEYTNPITFINAFVDARQKHKDNFELILEEMEKAKINYENSIKKEAERINALYNTT